MIIWIVTQGTRPPRAFMGAADALAFGASQLNPRFRLPVLWKQDHDASAPMRVGIWRQNEEEQPTLVPLGEFSHIIQEYLTVPPKRELVIR